MRCGAHSQSTRTSDRTRCRLCSRKRSSSSIAAARSSSSPTALISATVGGLEGLKKWLMERRKLFQQRESLSSDIVPKGLLLMGIPGCGKSLSVRAIASVLQLPLYRIDMIDIFSGRHGEPEGAFVHACRTLESMAPAIVWFDEIEMAITSTESAGQQGRIFAFFLTWMQDKSARPVRRRDRQSHRPAARRNDPQRPLRRGFLRRSAARAGARRRFSKSTSRGAASTPRSSTSARSSNRRATGPAPKSSNAWSRR